ncbi:recombinase family protein [Caulobacter vibrioides]|nr:recombinase family protein [Caulobacter vibrioides]
MSRTFAYCRVSTSDQSAENQIAEIKSAGFAVADQRVILEVISGSTPSHKRPLFSRLEDRLEPGDVLIVTKLDRLGRSALDVRETIDRLGAMDVRVHCLSLGGMDLTSPAGRMTMGVIAAVAEFERDLLIERTNVGLARAKANGRKLGRKPNFNEAQKREVLAKRKEGLSQREVAKAYKVSRSAIQRVERELSLL